MVERNISVRFIVLSDGYVNYRAKIRIYMLLVEFLFVIMYHLGKLFSQYRKMWGEKVKFEANGMLTAGFHDCSVQEFIATFVDEFPTSQRRKLIVDSLWEFAKEVFDIGLPCEFWVDGSFVTTKVNPNDADLVLFLQAPNMNVVGPLVNDFRTRYAGTLDMYFAYAASVENLQLLGPVNYQQIVNQRNYWRGQFGFDRTDSPKGIVRISCDSIAEYLKGR